MGLVAELFGVVAQYAHGKSFALLAVSATTIITLCIILSHVFRQIFFKNKHEPPEVFSWFPFIGSTVWYGMDPPKFFAESRKKYGDVFTFILLGRRWTVNVGVAGNNRILNARQSTVNAEAIYGPLATPVFGEGVVYDCPLSRLMEQKKHVKYGLSVTAFKSYVPIIIQEVDDFLRKNPAFKGLNGRINMTQEIAALTLFTASASLQGPEVRSKFDSSFADLFCSLDLGFSPINFLFPHVPFPHNVKRDYARKTMTQTYMDIIQARRRGENKKTTEDMIWHLMQCSWKDGNALSDKEIAGMMIALLMAGQHSSSATQSWVLINLASKPHIQEELYAEQLRVVGPPGTPLEYEHLSQLTLHTAAIRETLRLHAPIHTILRQVTEPLLVEGTDWAIPPGNIVLSSPTVTARSDEHFPDAEDWDIHRWDDKTLVENEDDEKFDYGFGKISKGASSPYLPFGSGIHRCIGEQFAILQNVSITFNMVRNLRFKLPPGATKYKTDYSSLFSRPENPALVLWERRHLPN